MEAEDARRTADEEAQAKAGLGGPAAAAARAARTRRPWPARLVSWWRRLVGFPRAFWLERWVWVEWPIGIER